MPDTNKFCHMKSPV